MLGDIAAGGDPYPGPGSHMFEEAVQRPDPSRPADHPKVQAQRHHPGTVGAFRIETFEGVDRVLEPLGPVHIKLH